MLRVDNLTVSYGAVTALHGVTFEAADGAVTAVLGANGAGKTTLLMTICGKPRASQGNIRFDGEDITDWPSFRIARRGIAHAPEGRRIFPRMSVRENLQMGAVAGNQQHFASDLERVLSLFPRLGERLQQRGGTLSGGEQQMLAIGRALMGRPRLLLLDEPSLGLAPLVVRQIFEIIADINRSHGVTVFLVEQNAFHALRLAQRAYVMVNGRITLQGSGSQLLADPAVRAAYLEGGHGVATPPAEPAP